MNYAVVAQERLLTHEPIADLQRDALRFAFLTPPPLVANALSAYDLNFLVDAHNLLVALDPGLSEKALASMTSACLLQYTVTLDSQASISECCTAEKRIQQIVADFGEDVAETVCNLNGVVPHGYTHGLRHSFLLAKKRQTIPLKQVTWWSDKTCCVYLATEYTNAKRAQHPLDIEMIAQVYKRLFDSKWESDGLALNRLAFRLLSLLLSTHTVPEAKPQHQFSDAAIKQMALAAGFNLRDQPSGQMDLNPHVYNFARACYDAGRNSKS